MPGMSAIERMDRRLQREKPRTASWSLRINRPEQGSAEQIQLAAPNYITQQHATDPRMRHIIFRQRCAKTNWNLLRHGVLAEGEEEGAQPGAGAAKAPPSKSKFLLNALKDAGLTDGVKAKPGDEKRSKGGGLKSSMKKGGPGINVDVTPDAMSPRLGQKDAAGDRPKSAKMAVPSPMAKMAGLQMPLKSPKCPAKSPSAKKRAQFQLQQTHFAMDFDHLFEAYDTYDMISKAIAAHLNRDWHDHRPCVVVAYGAMKTGKTDMMQSLLPKILELYQPEVDAISVAKSELLVRGSHRGGSHRGAQSSKAASSTASSAGAAAVAPAAAKSAGTKSVISEGVASLDQRKYVGMVQTLGSAAQAGYVKFTGDECAVRCTPFKKAPNFVATEGPNEGGLEFKLEFFVRFDHGLSATVVPMTMMNLSVMPQMSEDGGFAGGMSKSKMTEFRIDANIGPTGVEEEESLVVTIIDSKGSTLSVGCIAEEIGPQRAGEWHKFSINVASATDTVNIFINGKEMPMKFYSVDSPKEFQWPEDTVLTIGGLGPPVDERGRAGKECLRHMNGGITDVRFWRGEKLMAYFPCNPKAKCGDSVSGELTEPAEMIYGAKMEKAEMMNDMALRFNGKDVYINCGVLGNLGQNLHQMTIDLLFKADDVEKDQAFLAVTDSMGRHQRLYFGIKDSSLIFTIQDSAGRVMEVMTQKCIEAKTWHHVVATTNGNFTSDTPDVQFRVDDMSAVVPHRVLVNNKPQNFVNFTQWVAMGAHNNHGKSIDNHYKGILRGVTVWQAGECLACWALNEGPSATIVVDHTGSGWNGIVNAGNHRRRMSQDVQWEPAIDSPPINPMMLEGVDWEELMFDNEDEESNIPTNPIAEQVARFAALAIFRMKREGGHFGKGTVCEIAWDLVHDKIRDMDYKEDIDEETGEVKGNNEGVMKTDVEGRRLDINDECYIEIGDQAKIGAELKKALAKLEEKDMAGAHLMLSFEIDHRRFCLFDLAGRPCGDMPSFEDSDTQGVLGRRSTFGKKETKLFQMKQYVHMSLNSLERDVLFPCGTDPALYHPARMRMKVARSLLGQLFQAQLRIRVLTEADKPKVRRPPTPPKPFEVGEPVVIEPDLEKAKENDNRWLDRMDKYCGRTGTIIVVREEEQKAQIEFELTQEDEEELAREEEARQKELAEQAKLPKDPRLADEPAEDAGPKKPTGPPSFLMVMANFTRPRPPTPEPEEMTDAEDTAPPVKTIERVRPASMHMVIHTTPNPVETEFKSIHNFQQKCETATRSAAARAVQRMARGRIGRKKFSMRQGHKNAAQGVAAAANAAADAAGRGDDLPPPPDVVTTTA